MDYPFLRMYEYIKRSKRRKMEMKQPTEAEFNNIQFEKRLQSLKDSQESINSCCQWCLENHVHHKKIVSCWLNVLKRVKVEQRVTLFYLANDVIQYSKRRNYEFVESWGTTLQKATTMVRDERVKHKILRIFKIWEQRGVYNEEFISDLSGLISASPTVRKSDDSHEFQSSYLITKIRNCSNLETDTDVKLKKLKEHNPKIQLDKGESLCASLKDRAHVDDVEKEIDEYANHMESYVNALKLEIKARSNLISLLVHADSQLENDRKDVKLVANAYRAFGARVKNVKKKLDEVLPTLGSPIPSPDVNAPSPSPDSDIELPVTETTTANTTTASVTQFPNAGYYNPVQPPNSQSGNNFTNNGFTSFMGSNLPFDMQNFTAASLFGSTTTQNTLANSTSITQTTDSFSVNNSISSLFSSIAQPPPPPDITPLSANTGYRGVPPPVAANFQGVPPPVTTSFQYGSNAMPLLPPPMPPFSKSESGYGSSSVYSDVYSTPTSANYDTNASSYDSSAAYQPSDDYNTSTYDTQIPTYNAAAVPYDASVEPAYVNDNSSYDGVANPWEPTEQQSWVDPPLNSDTPESPPIFEKEAYTEPIEYHDTVDHGNGGGDVDHRVLPALNSPAVGGKMGLGHRGKDVDHRNLISLTGSPAAENTNPPPTTTKDPPWNSQSDQDYRNVPPSQSIAVSTPTGADRDYRMHFNFEQLKLPPPPPPPKSMPSALKLGPKKPGASPRKMQDNVESIDMDLSDDENLAQEPMPDNLKVIVDPDKKALEPPPPFLELPDDLDANSFLDDLNNDLNSSEFTANLSDDSQGLPTFPPPNPMWNNNYGMGDLPPNIPSIPPCANWMEPNFHNEYPGGFQGRGNKRGNFNNRGHHHRNNEFRGGHDRGGRGWNYRGGFRGNNNRNARGGGNHRGGGFNRGRGRGPPFRGNFRGGF